MKMSILIVCRQIAIAIMVGAASFLLDMILLRLALQIEFIPLKSLAHTDPNQLEALLFSVIWRAIALAIVGAFLASTSVCLVVRPAGYWAVVVGAVFPVLAITWPVSSVREVVIWIFVALSGALGVLTASCIRRSVTGPEGNKHGNPGVY